MIKEIFDNSSERLREIIYKKLVYTTRHTPLLKVYFLAKKLGALV